MSYKISKLQIATALILIIASLPIAFMSEISINGCCGGEVRYRQGIGYLVGGLIGFIGLSMIIRQCIKFRRVKP